MKIATNTRPGVSGRAEFEGAVDLMRRAASPIPPKRAEVEVGLAGRRRMASLNRAYRGRRGAPEILTFSYADDPGSIAGRGPVGEIVLCWPSVVTGARARGVPVIPYLIRLLVHGLMHLRGYRHDDERSARVMERAERRYVSGCVENELIDDLFA